MPLRSIPIVTNVRISFFLIKQLLFLTGKYMLKLSKNGEQYNKMPGKPERIFINNF